MDIRMFPVSLFLFFLFLFSLSSKLLKAENVPAVFVFGDSLVDVGNNNDLPDPTPRANFPHNGIDFPTNKSTGRFSNGKNVADLISEKLGLPTSPPYHSLSKEKNASYTNGVSFASGGGGIFNSPNQMFGQAITLPEQVDDFVAVHKILLDQLNSSAEQYFKKSLYVIAIGSTDLFEYFESSDLRNKSTPQQFIDAMANTLKEQLKRLHEFDARKFFLPGVATIGCIPAERVKSKTHECDQEVNFWSVKYNEALKTKLKELKSELQDINYCYFESYKLVEKVLETPSSYGFNEIKEACCGHGELRAKYPCLPNSTYCSNRTDHVFWDMYHPTEAAAKVFVDTIFDGPLECTVPVNITQLVYA